MSEAVNEDAPVKGGIAKKKSSAYIGLILAAFMFFTKSTKIMAALKAFSFSKPLITVISMAISAVLYGIWLGPWFGIGLVLLIFVHEMGHIVALRLKGFETSGPVFIPFLGAAIFAPKFEDRDTEAFVGYGGPFLGTIAALACLAAWPYAEGKNAEILLILSYVGVFINLFNMIPISPLDGGRITQAVGSWFKYVGVIVLFAYTLAVRQPGLILIWLFVLDGFDGMRLWFRPVIGGALLVSMAALFALGYGGDMPWYIMVVDCALGLVFLIIFIAKDQRRKAEGEQDAVDERPYPSTAVRAKWLAYYLVLTVIMSGVLLWQVQHMPHKVKEHSERLTTPVVQ